MWIYMLDPPIINVLAVFQHRCCLSQDYLIIAGLYLIRFNSVFINEASRPSVEVLYQFRINFSLVDCKFISCIFIMKLRMEQLFR